MSSLRSHIPMGYRLFMAHKGIANETAKGLHSLRVLQKYSHLKSPILVFDNFCSLYIDEVMLEKQSYFAYWVGDWIEVPHHPEDPYDIWANIGCGG